MYTFLKARIFCCLKSGLQCSSWKNVWSNAWLSNSFVLEHVRNFLGMPLYHQRGPVHSASETARYLLCRRPNVCRTFASSPITNNSPFLIPYLFFIKCTNIIILCSIKNYIFQQDVTVCGRGPKVMGMIII